MALDPDDQYLFGENLRKHRASISDAFLGTKVYVNVNVNVNSKNLDVGASRRFSVLDHSTNSLRTT
jgi:hypothetical protein